LPGAEVMDEQRWRHVHAARRMRREPTEAESISWEAVRVRVNVLGLKFRRQHPAGGFILDFYCARLKLAVEIDGGIHELRPERDEERTHALSRLGIRVIRFSNDEILNRMPKAMPKLEAVHRSGLGVPPSPLRAHD
jgi:very-short-patch-repair endonuclease